MASASQLPSSSASSNRNLYDVLRSLSSRSLKRARTEDSEDREEVVQHEDNASPPLPLSSDTATTQNDHDKEDREDRFIQLASTVLFTDASCRKNIKRKRETKDASATTPTQNSDNKTVVKTEKDVTNPLNLVDVHIQSDLDRYKELLKAEEEQIQHIEASRKRIRQEQVDLWGLYKYGLTKIKNLNDLSKAPDAVMPGNLGQ
mmetsp:Transcript_37153/g.90313  ORF Transcript_37153/g.90313 Transcript_37153/m.90313 type:complete len:203 (-) Transcript_37153:158-766(-)